TEPTASCGNVPAGDRTAAFAPLSKARDSSWASKSGTYRRRGRSRATWGQKRLTTRKGELRSDTVVFFPDKVQASQFVHLPVVIVALSIGPFQRDGQGFLVSARPLARENGRSS